jgi:hypothetical protein
VATVVTAAGWLAAQPALNFVMTAEPEVVLPHLAFDGADRVLRAGARVIAPSLRRFLDGGDGGDDEYADSERAGEWLARMILSYVSCPTDSVDLADPISVRRLVADFVVPGLVSVSNASGR